MKAGPGVLLVLLSPVMFAGSPIAANPRASLTDLLGVIRGAESVTVERLGAVPAPPRTAANPGPAAWRTRVLTTAQASRAWAGRFADVLAAARPCDTCRTCRLEWWPTEHLDQVLIDVRTRSGARRVRAQLLFVERCARLSGADRRADPLDITGVAPSLFDLVREALPRDTVLQHMTGPPRSRRDAEPEREPAAVDVPGPLDELPEPILRINPTPPRFTGGEPDSGMVMVRVFVGADGRVKRASVERSLHATLDSAAVQAARRWVFKPALKDHRPIPVWISIPFRFPTNSP
jgi:TonB family protein